MARLPKKDEVFVIFERVSARTPGPGDTDDVRSLSVPDLTVFLIFEFGNTGDLRGWLADTTGAFTLVAIEALERVVAIETADLLRRALQIFPDSLPLGKAKGVRNLYT